MMTSLICTMCRDTLETKPALTTTCGHIFCSDCAMDQFTAGPTCPVCHRVQTLDQLIRLFPEYGTVSLDPASGIIASPDMPISAMSQPPPYQTTPPSESAPSSHITPPPESVPSPLHITPSTSVSSLRISIDSTGKRLPWTQAGVVPACDLDGCPVFLGVAAFKDGMHPCKIRVTPEGHPRPKVPYGGKEHDHSGTILLLPFNLATMEWVQASHGTIPPGRRPVEGGYERLGGKKLYHALALVEGVSVPGKAGENGHLVSSVSITGGWTLTYMGRVGRSERTVRWSRAYRSNIRTSVSVPWLMRLYLP